MQEELYAHNPHEGNGNEGTGGEGGEQQTMELEKMIEDVERDNPSELAVLEAGDDAAARHRGSSDTDHNSLSSMSRENPDGVTEGAMEVLQQGRSAFAIVAGDAITGEILEQVDAQGVLDGQGAIITGLAKGGVPLTASALLFTLTDNKDVRNILLGMGVRGARELLGSALTVIPLGPGGGSVEGPAFLEGEASVSQPQLGSGFTVEDEKQALPAAGQTSVSEPDLGSGFASDREPQPAQVLPGSNDV